ncbi:MAG: amidase family protein [Acidimicrobiia bacterium]
MEPWFGSALDTAALIRGGVVSSREATESALRRIDQVNPAVNAVVELRAEEALKEAAAADESAVDGGDRAFHGVPITVKEAFNVAGMHTTWGNPYLEEYVADWDATVVRRLKEAGAVIVGKTNVPFMLGDFGQTGNELHGVTNNPWDPTRTAGGSSGGAAAAVAAGLSFLDYGSDLAGSIRIPASFCGVYGLKPSVGLVPGTGFQPPGPPAHPTDMAYMSALGPLGRSARDLRAALGVTVGPEQPAGKAYTWRLPSPRHTTLRDHRVGLVLDHESAPVSSEVGSVLSDTADSLAKSGATVIEGWPRDIDPSDNFESFGFHIRLFLAYSEPDNTDFDMGQFIEQERRRMRSRALWGRYFEDVDVFLCPTNFTPAFPHDARPFESRTVETPEGPRSYADQPFWISHASLAGLPALSAPVGRTPSGLPIGIQVVGPLYEDDTALTFAELMAETVGGYQPPPV